MRFWDLESVGIQSQETAKPTVSRNTILQKFNDELLYSSEMSQYMFGLPRKSEVYCEKLSNNNYVAETRLKNIHICPLDPDTRLKDKGYEAFSKCLAEETVEIAPPEEIQTSNITYLFHLPTVKNYALNTGIRPVLDASEKSANGKSLNDIMEMGTSLNPKLDQCLSGLELNSEDVATIMYPLISRLRESVALEWSHCVDVDGSESNLKFTLDFLYREIYRQERAGDVCTTMH